jgi:hypothetical protein
MEMKTMTLQQIILTSTVTLTLAVASTVLAGQPADPMLSGDEPMNVDDAAQLKTPDPSAKAQAETEKMLKEEAPDISGDMPMNADDAAQIKAPK